MHGEGDNLPGLVIDMYAHTAVMQAHSVGMHYARHQIAEALKAVLGDSLQNIYYKSEATLPYKANLGSENGYLYGGEVEDIALENGLKFCVDWDKRRGSLLTNAKTARCWNAMPKGVPY